MLDYTKDGLVVDYKTSEEWAAQAMYVNIKDLPDLAKEYMLFLTGMNGICTEVILTAYNHYAQAILKLPCGDSLYQLDEGAKGWFLANW